MSEYTPEFIKRACQNHNPLIKALFRQTDNMAFLINHADIGTWYGKLCTELEEDRKVLDTAEKSPSEDDELIETLKAARTSMLDSGYDRSSTIIKKITAAIAKGR